MNVLDLARPELRWLEPYASARMQAGPAAVMLNANESPWPATDGAGQGLNRYPEGQPRALRKCLAGLYGVDAQRILIGRGSDEFIDLLVRAFCRPERDAILICPPTFGMYAVCAGVQGAGVVEVPLNQDFELDADAVLAACTPAVKLVFLCSPNNPTGALVPLASIERLAAALAERALLVVDEAYIEFAGSDSAATLLPGFPNLAVLRTLSKAWALAGARVGSLLADPVVIELLRRIMPPYPLPTPSVDAALATLTAQGERRMRQRAARIIRERERLAGCLRHVPEVRAVLPSCANFLNVRFEDAARTRQCLAAQGIVVRDVGDCRGLANCLRISVGTAAQNTRLLDVLTKPCSPRKKDWEKAAATPRTAESSP